MGVVTEISTRMKVKIFDGLIVGMVLIGDGIVVVGNDYVALNCGFLS